MPRRSADKLEETNKDSVKFEDSEPEGSEPSPDAPSTGNSGGEKGDTGGEEGGDAATPSAPSGEVQTDTVATDTTAGGTAPGSTAAESKVVQTYTYVLNFSVDGCAGPDLRAREVATDWAGAVFGEGAKAEEDTTGMQVWATALVSARWVAQLQAEPATSFGGKRVMELGAGAGVPGLCALFYSDAAKVILTDVFKLTLNNLRYNVALNLKHAGTRSYADVEVRELDWRRRDPATAGTVDVLLGSDLVYDNELVPPLLELIDHVLAPDGVFYMVAAAGRQGVATLVDALRQTNFEVGEVVAGEGLKANPLASKSEDELELHFNELHATTHTLYTVRRKGV